VNRLSQRFLMTGKGKGVDRGRLLVPHGLSWSLRPRNRRPRPKTLISSAAAGNLQTKSFDEVKAPPAAVEKAWSMASRRRTQRCFDFPAGSSHRKEIPRFGLAERNFLHQAWADSERERNPESHACCTTASSGEFRLQPCTNSQSGG